MATLPSAAAMVPHHVLIVGGGFAGLECARKLANDPRFSITLIDRTNHHLFQPLLYQVATASLTAPDIARSIRQILERARNVTVLMDEIVRIDAKHRIAVGRREKEYSYDSLVLAAGAQTSFFGNDHWETYCLGLKTLADAQNVRRTVLSNLERAELCDDLEERRRLMTVAIVGGGPTGVELAGAFADLVLRSLKSNFRRIDTSHLRVILIEGSTDILEAYDPGQRRYAKRRLEQLGVEVWTSTRVAGVRSGEVELANGESLEAAAIIWAAGVAAVPLGATIGASVDRGGYLSPCADLSLADNPEIFVAGDLARMRDRKDRPVPGVAPAAVQMGAHVAKVLKQDARLRAGGCSEERIHQQRPHFRYRDKGMMAIIGKNAAVVKAGKLRLRGWLAWLMWLFVHIAFLVGFRNKLAVLLGWAYAYLRNNPEARVIVYPPAAKKP